METCACTTEEMTANGYYFKGQSAICKKCDLPYPGYDSAVFQSESKTKRSIPKPQVDFEKRDKLYSRLEAMNGLVTFIWIWVLLVSIPVSFAGAYVTGSFNGVIFVSILMFAISMQAPFILLFKGMREIMRAIVDSN